MATNNDLFLESIIDGNHSVYGFKLKPLSLFHLTLLEKYCPSVLSGMAVNEGELQKAAMICSAQYLNHFYSAAKSIRAYFLPFYNFNKQLDSFAAYLADYMTFPETMESTGEPKNNPFPFPLVFAGKLIKETGYSFRHVFYEMSISQIYWLVSVMGFIESGESSVISDKEKAIYAAIKEKEGMTE